MKKVLLAFFLVLSVTALFGVKAFAAGTGNLVVHFQAWDGDYTDLGSWAWGDTAAGKRMDGTDDFGAYWNYNDLAVGTEVGFIAVYWEGDGPNWDKKLTGDMNIPSDTIIEDETVHVYIFQGAATVKEEGVITDSQVFVASNEHYNLLLTYFDPSGSYEETLGVHAWNGWVDVPAEWGTPAQVFSTAGKTSDDKVVKAAMLHSTASDAGLLIYAGEDANKKTGDVNLSAALSETPALGDVGVAYVLSKGDGYTAGDNIYYNEPTTFSEEAFTFKLTEYNAETSSGTYAVDPTTIIVKTSALVSSPLTAEGAIEYLAMQEIEAWFEVRANLGEGEYGSALRIERVDFATTNETLNSFVIILQTALVNDAEYTLFFDNGEVQADIDLAMDTEAPELVFVSPAGIVDTPEAQRIIEVPWGTPFNQNLFPRFRAVDNRDGDLTSFVFVPKGENSVLDTRTEGDYVIVLRVVDKWGNVTDEAFTFRVVKGE
ncbi:pullulanase-associated domain-containing protein [Mariniplasma anaerobium]|uniref:Pullulanase carbohydrate-binding module 41 domain-containing protein n=1 Tax=Mariniplasma anaerobium TaxID=2735436 RepID=A0A7U9XXD3_9MOLU|nr:pullulanase-associated domain-containing protein [Mariniplasma anaerobium]BCR36444.1 hypothetical protein MPAN_013370 [Mariniplasma anaerobium]